MASIVKGIIDHIEGKIKEALPSIERSRYYFVLSNPEEAKSDFIFAVRPGSGSSVGGTIGNVTTEQDFEIEIVRKYNDKIRAKNDEQIRKTEDLLYQDNEAILQKLVKNTHPDILLVKGPAFGAPDYDENTKHVSITFTYSITYKNRIQGVA